MGTDSDTEGKELELQISEEGFVKTAIPAEKKKVNP